MTPPVETLRLETTSFDGAAAAGVIAPLAALRRRAPDLARSATARTALMLAIHGEAAVLWSTGPADLPWLGDGLAYLGPAADRLFTPLGLRIATPPALLPACLRRLAEESDVAPPLLVAPAGLAATPGAGKARLDPSDAVLALDLRASAPVAAVDWRRLAAGGGTAP